MSEQTKHLVAGCATTVLAVILGAVLMSILIGCGEMTEAGWYEKVNPQTGETLTVQGPTTRGKTGKQTLEPLTIKPDGTVEFGGGSIEAAVASLHGSPVLLYIGAGVAVAAVLIAWLVGRAMLGVIGAALGAGLIGLAYYPWVGAVAAGLAIAAGAVYVVLALLDARKDKKALEEVVTSVNVAVPKDVRKNVMGNIQSRETSDRVDEVKKRRDL